MLLTPHVRDALTYFGGLFATSAIAWLAYVPLGPDRVPGDLSLGQIFWWFWLAPLPYLLAWFLLVVPSVARALLAVAVIAAANLLVTTIGLLFGLFTFGVLAIPAIIGAGWVLGYVVALAHARAIGWVEWQAWWLIHCTGGMAAGVGLALAGVITAATATRTSPTYRDWLTLGVVSASGFVVHAISARRKLHEDGSATAPPARMGILVGVAYLVPMLEISSVAPQYGSLAWPLHLREAADAVSASRNATRAPLASSAEERR